MRKYSKSFTSNETWGTSSPYTKNFAPACRGQISRLYQVRGGRRTLKDDVIMRNGFVDGWVSCNCCCCLSVSQWDPSSAATCLIKARNYTIFNSHVMRCWKLHQKGSVAWCLNWRFGNNQRSEVARDQSSNRSSQWPILCT
jgi:hypothetical protein